MPTPLTLVDCILGRHLLKSIHISLQEKIVEFSTLRQSTISQNYFVRWQKSLPISQYDSSVCVPEDDSFDYTVFVPLAPWISAPQLPLVELSEDSLYSRYLYGTSDPRCWGHFPHFFSSLWSCYHNSSWLGCFLMPWKCVSLCVYTYMCACVYIYI